MTNTVSIHKEIEAELIEVECRYCKREYEELAELVNNHPRMCPKCED